MIVPVHESNERTRIQDILRATTHLLKPSRIERSAGPFMMPAASGAKRKELSLGLIFLSLIKRVLVPRAFFNEDLILIDFMITVNPMGSADSIRIN